jgi:lipopolysaccharide/colanic/teichoic acid biosynthesis glycosyltransferase
MLLGVRGSQLPTSARAVKRLFDIAFAGAGFLVALPIFALVAIAIKLDSSGPVFYRQARVGRRNQRFDILKFRTMDVGAHDRRAELFHLNEADGLFKIEDDPRVTRVGRLLRRSSLDELPQLLNVLRGQMSVVGPRPLVAEEDALVTGYDRRRLDLTPGMTGPWQILGSARVPLSEMVRIDYLYVTGWTLWSDLKVVLRTIPYVLSRRGM